MRLLQGTGLVDRLRFIAACNRQRVRLLIDYTMRGWGCTAAIALVSWQLRLRLRHIKRSGSGLWDQSNWFGPVRRRRQTAYRGTEQVMLDVIRNARISLDIVVFAAYRVLVLSRAIEQAFQRGVRVRFVLESREEGDGKISFVAATALGASGSHVAEVYVWPQSQRSPNDRGQRGALHAKFIVADSATLFVSSANLTEHAMSLNLESGVLIRGGAEPARATAMIDSLIHRGVLARVT